MKTLVVAIFFFSTYIVMATCGFVFPPSASKRLSIDDKIKELGGTHLNLAADIARDPPTGKGILNKEGMF